MGEYGTRVCYKIIVLFIAMMAGYVAKKSKILDGHSTKALSSLLAYITNPCLLFASLQIDRSNEIIKTSAIVLVVSFAVHLSMAVAGKFIFSRVKDGRDAGVYAFGLTYMNCGFMGYPIMQAMFPEYGLVYGAIYTIPFNVFVWTHGVAVMDSSGGKAPDFKKILLNPGIISTILASICFVWQIRLPEVAVEGIDMVGGMTFPLSMIIIGSLLADQKLLPLLKDLKLFAFSVLKLAIVPLLMLGVCLGLKDVMGITASLVCITMCATPTAANTAVFAEVYDSNSALAARLVGITTLYSLISMPLILILAEKFLV